MRALVVPMHVRLALLTVGTLVLGGCGAKTPLETEPPRDAGRRVDPPRDAAPTADGFVEVDAAICGGPCDDGLFCNGREICTLEGCVNLGLPACDDGDECTLDTCSEATDRCTNERVDRDEDRDGLTGCGGDCDDSNPAVFPGAAEICDMVDQDCDGRFDEGTLSECGDCRRGCTVVDIPRETGGDWGSNPDSELSGVEVRPDGSLVLGSTRSERNFAWIANTRFGSVTKLDLNTGAQLGEYDSALLGAGNHARVPGEECDTLGGSGNCPSRTAVDLRGAVYVANRAFEHQPTVTKIAGRVEDCIDRNRNGRIDTSEDLNANGVIDRGTSEYLGQGDECILWTVDVGGVGGIARAVAIDADGFVWVGLHDDMNAVKLDPSDGRTLRTVNLSRRFENFRPYGATVTSDGFVYFVEVASGRIRGVDTATDTVTVRTQAADGDCQGSYGIAVDQRDRIWLAGFHCPKAHRYDPATGDWFSVELPDSGGTRGIAADDRGYVYVAASHEFIRLGGPGGISLGRETARVTRFRADDGLDMTIYGTAANPLPGSGSVGIGLDDDRRIWVVNQVSGTATRLDPTTGDTREYPVGDTPYTYSDFTGFALRTFTAPSGFYRTVLEAPCPGAVTFERLSWDASVPANARLEVRVRSAPTRAGLGAATWVGDFTTSPVDLLAPPGPVPPGNFLEVEVMLISEDEVATPAVRNLQVQYLCPL